MYFFLFILFNITIFSYNRVLKQHTHLRLIPIEV